MGGRKRGAAWLAAAIVVTACGNATNDASPSGFAENAPGNGGDTNGGGGSGGGLGATPSAGGDAGLPPETKDEGAYQSPVSTGEVVWIANPDSGRVAYIDAASLAVKTIAAGDGPTYLAAVPDAKERRSDCCH